MTTTKTTSLHFYWTRIFVPLILILLGLSFVIVFALPQVQMISTASVYKSIRALDSLKV
jgi:hypothetical protein